MKLLINLENSEIFEEIHIDNTDNIETLKYLIQATLDIPYNEIKIILDGNVLVLPDSTIISSSKIEENSLLIIRKQKSGLLIDPNQSLFGNNNNNTTTNTNNNTNNTNNPNNNNNNNNLLSNNLDSIFDNTMKILENKDPNALYRNRAKQYVKDIKDRYLTNPDELNLLFQHDVKLAEAITSGNDVYIEDHIIEKIKTQENKQKTEKDEYLRLINSKSNDEEAQKKIEDYINKEKIEENRKMALEYLPESFFKIHSLYIPLKINKYKVIALVDTGAEITSMSVDIAHKCGLYNLIDKSQEGWVRGVGKSKIVGVIYAANMEINGRFIMGKITVIDNISIGFIFGLDNMRSHKCTIELAKDSIVFPDSDIKLQFLSDGEVKKYKEEIFDQDKEIFDDKDYDKKLDDNKGDNKDNTKDDKVEKK